MSREPSATPPASERNWRVLLVEDDSHAAQFTGLVVDRHIGASMDCVATVQAAIAQIARVRYDLIVLDLGLPDACGVEAVHAVRQVTCVPVLVASSADERREEALAAGADAFLPKADADASTFASAVLRTLMR